MSSSASRPAETPVVTFGEKVRAEIYQSPALHGVTLPFSVRLVRDYTDSTGETQTGAFFNLEHLVDLTLVISQAQSWLREHETAPVS